MASVSKNNANNPPKSELKLHRIYVKNCLFEAINLNVALIENPPQPTIDLQVSVNAFSREKNVHEAVLALQITAKHQDSLLWRAQLQQAGLYTLNDFSEEDEKRILNGFCMNQLYPYACEKINSLVVQGGFSPIYLNPMNFDALYQEQINQEVLPTT